MKPDVTATWPLDVALAGAVENDQALRAILADSELGSAGIYSGRAPSDSKMPYIVIGSPAEDPKNLFARKGNDIRQALHVWSEKEGHEEVKLIYRHLVRLLTGVPLTLEGHQLLRGAMRLVIILNDPGPPPATHLVAEYQVITIEAANG